MVGAQVERDVHRHLGQLAVGPSDVRRVLHVWSPISQETTAHHGEVEYGTALIDPTKAEPLVRRARTLVDLAIAIVRLGR